jgi:DNA-binding MarR family transcriptional regulator
MIRAELTPLGREKQAAGERQLSMLMRDVTNAVSAEDRDALSRVFAALE